MGIIANPRTVNASVLPKNTEIEMMIGRVIKYFNIFRHLGLLSSKCPKKIFQTKKKLLTIAISNHIVLVLNSMTIFFLIYFTMMAENLPTNGNNTEVIFANNGIAKCDTMNSYRCVLKND
jgi:hypothetical protein